MKFSILLPTHNRADVLPFAIRSALLQTETDWELLIAGDGCTDSTADVVATFNDPRIHWFDLPKAPGYGCANRNTVLEKARGDYIAYLAHDDIWLPDHLGLLSQCMEKTRSDFAYSRPIWVEPGGSIFPGDFDLNRPGVRQAFMSFQQSGIPSTCIMHRRSCFEQTGYWDVTLPRHADWDLWVRIISKTGPPAYLSTPTCLHFRANWRKESNVVSNLADYSEFQESLPSLNLRSAQNEQQSAWQELESNPAEWPAALRATIAKSDTWFQDRENEATTAFDASLRTLFGPKGYVIHAIDNDPQLILPEFDIAGCKKILIRIEIISPAATTLQIFHTTHQSPRYTEEQSRRFPLYAFKNVIHHSLDTNGLAGPLRLDPGTLPGDYIISSFEVRAANPSP